MSNHGIISDDWIVSYAAGSLSEAHALIVASHVEFHADLQEKVADAEAIGGVLMEQAEPSVLSSKAFDNVWEKIEQSPVSKQSSETHAIKASAKQISERESKLPPSLQKYLGKELDELDWRLMGPGMKQKRLWTGPNGECLWLLKARGGTKIPIHDHRGGEMTLVLQGSYHVGDQPYTPGLIEITDTDIQNHQPIIDPGKECICLVVTEAPIKLHSFIGRLLQPLIGL